MDQFPKHICAGNFNKFPIIRKSQDLLRQTREEISNKLMNQKKSHTIYVDDENDDETVRYVAKIIKEELRQRGFYVDLIESTTYPMEDLVFIDINISLPTDEY